MEYNLTGAFLVGLMGAGHCFGMCGGLVGAFSSQLPAARRGQNPLAQQLSFLLPYNLGRILSYTWPALWWGGLQPGLACCLISISTSWCSGSLPV